MAILNVSELVEQQGGPGCRPEDAVVADADNGVVYVQQGPHAPDGVRWLAGVDTHHSFGTHSAPWHLMEVRCWYPASAEHPQHVQAAHDNTACPGACNVRKARLHCPSVQRLCCTHAIPQACLA